MRILVNHPYLFFRISFYACEIQKVLGIQAGSSVYFAQWLLSIALKSFFFPGKYAWAPLEWARIRLIRFFGGKKEKSICIQPSDQFFHPKQLALAFDTDAFMYQCACALRDLNLWSWQRLPQPYRNNEDTEHRGRSCIISGFVSEDIIVIMVLLWSNW